MSQFSSSDYFHVILAGVQGGGRPLTGLREHVGDKGYVVSSLSTPASSRWGEYRLKTYYRHLAQEIVGQAQGKLIRIYAHSLGGIELLDFMRALAVRSDLPQGSLEVILISLPGVGQRGLGGVWRVGRRLAKVIQTLGLYDQYHLFPVMAEQDAAICQKRAVFLSEWLPRLLPNTLKRAKMQQDLAAIEAQLASGATVLAGAQGAAGQQEDYHGHRHLLMKGLIEKIIAGEHLLEETHLHYLGSYGENSPKRGANFAYLSLGLQLLAKTLQTLYLGVDRKLLEAVEGCQQLGVTLQLGVVILGRDELVYKQDYAALIQLAQAKAIAIYCHTFESHEHSSVAYNWDFIDTLEALQLTQPRTPKRDTKLN